MAALQRLSVTSISSYSRLPKGRFMTRKEVCSKKFIRGWHDSCYSRVKGTRADGWKG